MGGKDIVSFTLTGIAIQVNAIFLKIQTIEWIFHDIKMPYDIYKNRSYGI
jgi:hypothetical protein